MGVTVIIWFVLKIVKDYFNYNIYNFKTKHIYTDNCALLGCYAVSSGNSVPTFRDNLSFPPSRVKNQTNPSRILDP